MSDETQHEGICPRCGGDAVERELIRFTTDEVIAGVVFFCETCALTSKVLSSDRVLWFDTHRLWASNALGDDTLETFLGRWEKKVGRPSHGSPEPLGPILPKV